MSNTKLADALRALLQIRNRPISACDPVRLEAEAALASYEAEPAEGFVTSADSLTTQLRGYAVAVQDEQPYWADKIKAACDELEAQAEAKPAAEPVAWAISYNGKTPYALWDYGEGALLDLEVKRLGGTASKMPLYAAPAAPAPVPLSFTHIDGLAAVDFPSRQWNAAQRFARAIERAHGIGIAASKGEQA
jgi:hypothetical protein